MYIHLRKKLIAACIAFLLVVVTAAEAAAQNPIDPCKPFLIVKAAAFIAGAKDTVINTAKVLSILPEYIADGFKLRLTDTTFRVVEFRFGLWSARTGIYYEQVFQGDSLEPAKLTIASREVVLGAARYFIDAIRVSRHNNCFWVPGVQYTTRNNPPPDLPARIRSSSPHTH